MQTKHSRRVIAGFTLIELMIVVVIIAILAAIAVPSYLKYAQRSRRADALSALSTDQGILERCYAKIFDYSKVTVAGSGCGSLSTTAPNPSSGGYYGVGLVLPAPASTGAAISSYTLTATPVAGSAQAGDTQCAQIILTSANKRTAYDTSGVDQTVACWKQ
ncbi:MAG: type IV pilin protein [Rhodanobacter sp.]